MVTVSKRKGFYFPAICYDIANELPERLKWPYVETIVRYMLFDIEPCTDDAVHLAFVSCKPHLDAVVNKRVRHNRSGDKKRKKVSDEIQQAKDEVAAAILSANAGKERDDNGGTGYHHLRFAI